MSEKHEEGVGLTQWKTVEGAVALHAWAIGTGIHRSTDACPILRPPLLALCLGQLDKAIAMLRAQGYPQVPVLLVTDDGKVPPHAWLDPPSPGLSSLTAKSRGDA